MFVLFPCIVHKQQGIKPGVLMDRKLFFDTVRGNTVLFSGRLSSDQVEGMEAILDAAERYFSEDPGKSAAKLRGTRIHWVAAVLANVLHETGSRMVPIKETVMPHHRNRKPSDTEVIARLDRAWAAGNLPWVREPYWREGWFGRGQIQITHRRNYENLGKRLGVDFVRLPSLALDPANSADIAMVGMAEGLFTGRGLGAYFNDEGLVNVNGARRIVNGPEGPRDENGVTALDRRIGVYHMAFRNALDVSEFLLFQPRPPAPPGLFSRFLQQLRIMFT